MASVFSCFTLSAAIRASSASTFTVRERPPRFMPTVKLCLVITSIILPLIFATPFTSAHNGSTQNTTRDDLGLSAPRSFASSRSRRLRQRQGSWRGGGWSFGETRFAKCVQVVVKLRRFAYASRDVPRDAPGRQPWIE